MAIVWLLAAGGAVAETREYGSHPAAVAFIATMVEEYGFERDALRELFSEARYQDSIIRAMERPAERVKPWHEYRQIFLTERRIRDGERFWRDHAATLERAQHDYGVDPAIVVAIIGVETFYGRITGSFRVLDALATLAFDYPKRGEFFARELEQYLLLTREQGVDPLSLKGSYAGAMGYGQFIPSSYRAYAVDFNGDGNADIWADPVDAIGSVANYFARHGWRAGAPVVVPAAASEDHDREAVNVLARPTLSPAELAARGFRPLSDPAPEAPAFPLELEGSDGVEYWLAYDNFYVITRYNRSHRYAMAVYQLSRALVDRMAE
ncbi:MAG: lytic murein transglycosylase B [Porticoccaceae bacterium]|nr:lytic murein transglycosylase B [Porticoccaceae bacterium]